VLGRDEWAKDIRFASFKERLEHRALIQELLDVELAKKTTAQWLEIFAGKIPAAPIYNIAEALDNPFVAERERVQTLHLNGYGNYRMVAAPVLSGGVQAPDRPAPRLGQHTEELLSDLGYDTARLEALRKARII
jgi:succinate--hydroxymethylglutarate CoA-transferase